MPEKSQQNKDLVNKNFEAIDGALKASHVKIPPAKKIIELTNSGDEIDFLIKLSGEMAPGISPAMVKAIRESLKNKTIEPAKKSPNKKLYDELGDGIKKKDEEEANQQPKKTGSPEEEESSGTEKSDNPNANAQQETPEQEGAKQDGDDKEEKNKGRENAEKDNLTKEQKQEGAKKTGTGTDKTAGNAAKKLEGKASSQATQAGANALKKLGQQLLKQAGTWIARAIVVVGWPVIAIVAIILIILFAIGCAAILLKTGKLDSYTANAAGDYGQIQANLAASKIETIKKALDEDIPGFIKQIENIKNSAKGNKKEKEITDLTDDIIKDANELKDLPEPSGSESSGGGASSAGTKEELKSKIMDKVKKLVELISSDSSALAQELLNKCNEKIIICEFNAVADLTSQAKNGKMSDGVVLYAPLLDLLVQAANNGNRFCISVFDSGHNKGNSYHPKGAAVDLYCAIDSNGKRIEMSTFMNQSFSPDRLDVKLAQFLMGGKYPVSHDVIYENIPSGALKSTGNSFFINDVPPHQNHIHVEFNLSELNK